MVSCCSVKISFGNICLNSNCSFRKSDLKIQWGGLKVCRWLLIFILQEADLALRGPGAFLEASFQDAMGRSESDPLAVDDGTPGVIIFIISNGSGYSFCGNLHFAIEI